MATVIESEFDVEGESSAVAYSERRAINVSITITPPILPPDFCPLTWQELVNAAFAFDLNLPAGYTQIIVSDTTPIPEDRDKIWFKIDSEGRIIGIYSWSNTVSDWLEYRPKELFWATNDSTATANSDVLVTENGTPVLGAGQWFYWKHAVENTGAITATINGSAAIPVVKPDGSAILTGEVPADWALFAFYDGTNLRVISPLKFVVPAPPVPVPPNIVTARLPLPATWFRYSGSNAQDLTYPHLLGIRPSHVSATLVCKVNIVAANPLIGSTVDKTTVDVDSLLGMTDGSGSWFMQWNPIAITWDDVNIYLKLSIAEGGSGGPGTYPLDYSCVIRSGTRVMGTASVAASGSFSTSWDAQFTILP